MSRSARILVSCLAALAWPVACTCWAQSQAGPAQAAQAQATPLEGEPFTAELAGLDAAGLLRFNCGGEPRELPLDGLVDWGSPLDTARGPQIVLADGGLLMADCQGLNDDALKLESALFGPLTVPVEKVAAILFHPPADSLRRDKLVDRLSSPQGDADRLVLENGDELTGTLRELAETSLVLSTGVGDVSLEIDRIVGLGFNPRLVAREPAAGPRVLVGLADGSRLVARSLVIEPQEASLTVQPDTAWRAPREKLVSLQPLGGKVTYLSDLAPSGYRHVPFLRLEWPWRADRNVLGGRLRSRGRLYPKGIGMHSAARLTFKLDRPYRFFAAELALDDHVGPAGSVVFRVFVDRQERYASPIVRGESSPLPIQVDVTGGKSISLVVDFADRGDELDHADWLNARLVE